MHACSLVRPSRIPLVRRPPATAKTAGRNSGVDEAKRRGLRGRPHALSQTVSAQMTAGRFARPPESTGWSDAPSEPSVTSRLE